MIHLELTKQECDTILAILAKVQWDIANPLLMKIGAQMERQAGISALHSSNSSMLPKDLS